MVNVRAGSPGIGQGNVKMSEIRASTLCVAIPASGSTEVLTGIFGAYTVSFCCGRTSS